jgi:hypothetical protein
MAKRMILNKMISMMKMRLLEKLLELLLKAKIRTIKTKMTAEMKWQYKTMIKKICKTKMTLKTKFHLI